MVFITNMFHLSKKYSVFILIYISFVFLVFGFGFWFLVFGLFLLFLVLIGYILLVQDATSL